MTTMRARFDYGGPEGATFHVPEAYETSIHEASASPPEDPDVLLRAAFDHPLGADALSDAVRGKRRILLLVDDHTRGTRLDLVLPHVARAMDEARVDDDRVTVLTAQGTHRRMSEDEIDRKLGPFARRWRVRQHDWLATDEHAKLGETRGGMPIVVNRLLAKADFALGLGHVGVHAIMGYSGGAKIVHPGVSGRETEAWTHWEANWRTTEELMGDPENRIRREIEDGARVAGLGAVVNVVQDHEGRLHHAAYGDHVKAHRACAKVAAPLHETRVGEPADVVITDAKPADRDYWQSAKGLYTASVAVKEGGSIVLTSPNPEGVADNHPALFGLAGLALEEIRRRVERGEVEDVIAAAIAAYTARIRERARIHLFSTGIAPDASRRLGFTPHASLQDAVDAALAEQGPGARVAILRGAGNLLPLVRGRNDHLLPPARRSA